MYAHVPLRKKNDEEEERTSAYIAPYSLREVLAEAWGFAK